MSDHTDDQVVQTATGLGYVDLVEGTGARPKSGDTVKIIMLDVDGVPTGPLTFTFTFNHEETPNNANPCPYPTPPGEGCTDRVTIVQSATPTTFKIGGVDYTLSMNFLLNGNPVSEFITREGGVTNTSGLVGQFTLPLGTPALDCRP